MIPNIDIIINLLLPGLSTNAMPIIEPTACKPDQTKVVLFYAKHAS